MNREFGKMMWDETVLQTCMLIKVGRESVAVAAVCGGSEEAREECASQLVNTEMGQAERRPGVGHGVETNGRSWRRENWIRRFQCTDSGFEMLGRSCEEAVAALRLIYSGGFVAFRWRKGGKIRWQGRGDRGNVRGT